jgi:nitric oxide dioxygenase
MAISQQTIDIVKATAPIVKEHGEKITSRMYEIAFAERPDYKLGFENTWMVDAHGNGQAKKLAASVYAYATHIDNLDQLASAVERIAHKHVEARILPEQYPLIGAKLLEAMKDVLGDAATDEVINAWTEAYNALASIFINAEAKIYKQNDEALVEKLSKPTE